MWNVIFPLKIIIWHYFFYWNIHILPFRYPFYGVQFHPEKNIYEWIKNRNISHTANAIKANQYFANFFINESRKNLNQFDDLDEENAALIYNFPVTFTGLVKSSFEQSYLFSDTVEYRQNIHPYQSNHSNILKTSMLMLICMICMICTILLRTPCKV